MFTGPGTYRWLRPAGTWLKAGRAAAAGPEKACISNHGVGCASVMRRRNVLLRLFEGDLLAV